MAADRSAGDFGKKLREARERRGVTLRQIANSTKISVSVLEALERSDVSRLPGGIFGRGFVRSYAIEVGLDPEETIQDFIAQLPHDSVTAGHPVSQGIEDNEAVESQRQLATTFLRLIFLSLLVVGLVLYFAASEQRAPTPAEGPPVGSAAAPAPGPARTAEAAVEPATPAGVAGSDVVAVPAAPLVAAGADDRAGSPLTIGLAATRACWVSATVDGESVIERLLQPEERHTIEVRGDLVLRLGDAAAVTMTVNGAEAKPLGKAGEVVTIQLNPTNYKAYLPDG